MLGLEIGRRLPSVWDKWRAAIDREYIQKGAGDASLRGSDVILETWFTVVTWRRVMMKQVLRR